MARFSSSVPLNGGFSVRLSITAVAEMVSWLDSKWGNRGDNEGRTEISHVPPTSSYQYPIAKTVRHPTKQRNHPGQEYPEGLVEQSNEHNGS